MSLEIREMILRTTLTDTNAKGNGRGQDSKAVTPEVNTEHIIAECMERLMEWLKEENER